MGKISYTELELNGIKWEVWERLPRRSAGHLISRVIAVHSGKPYQCHQHSHTKTKFFTQSINMPPWPIHPNLTPLKRGAWGAFLVFFFFFFFKHNNNITKQNKKLAALPSRLNGGEGGTLSRFLGRNNPEVKPYFIQWANFYNNSMCLS